MVSHNVHIDMEVRICLFRVNVCNVHVNFSLKKMFFHIYYRESVYYLNMIFHVESSYIWFWKIFCNLNTDKEGNIDFTLSKNRKNLSCPFFFTLIIGIYLLYVFLLQKFIQIKASLTFFSLFWIFKKNFNKGEL